LERAGVYEKKAKKILCMFQMIASITTKAIRNRRNSLNPEDRDGKWGLGW